jgi:hypothetical protein
MGPHLGRGGLGPVCGGTNRVADFDPPSSNGGGNDE